MAQVYGADAPQSPPACSHHHGEAARASADPDSHLHPDPADVDPAEAAGVAALGTRIRPSRRTLLRGLVGAAAVPAVVGGVGLITPGVAGAQEAAPARQLVPRAVHEMTHRLTRDFPVVNTLVDQPVIEQIRFIEIDGFNANQITFNEHSGTHLDPPGHFRTGEPTADELEVERLVLPLAVIRIAERAAADADTELTIDDIRAHERRHGRLPRGCMVAMDSGWAARVPQPGAYLNTGPDGLFHFPGFCTEAAQFLINDRDVVAIASDSPSLDRAIAEAPTTHQAWLPTGRYGIENLAGASDVPDRGATVVVGGPRHEGSFGGPVRVLALVP
jgi:kynurenine formamidase